MMILAFGFFLIIVLVVQVTADLQCKDYIPVNWTTPRARVHVFDGSSPSAKFLPTNMSVGNPWKLASKKDAGAIFHLRTCNSASLGLKATKMVTCNNDGTGCFRDYYDYTQVINPSTGHCLSFEHYGANVSSAVFQKCDMNPKTPYQLWWTDRLIFLEEKCCFSAGPPDDWNPNFVMMQAVPVPLSAIEWPGWQYASDDQTVQLVNNSYPTINMYFQPVDPLTAK